MKRGYIVATPGMWWNDHVPSVICRGGEKLAWSWAGCSSISGFKCDNCKLIICYPGTEIPGRKEERIACPQCGKTYSFTHATVLEDDLLHCPACGADFLIADAKRR